MKYIVFIANTEFSFSVCYIYLDITFKDMCKYCEVKLDEFSSLGCHGATIVSGCGAECEITKVAEKYYLKIWADTEGLSKEPIKFCPFCGRSLTE